MTLTKEQLDGEFAKIFQDEANGLCFECGKKSKQWVELNHAIFICLNCAGLYRDSNTNCKVKSVGLDLFDSKDLQKLSIGGNRRFK